MRESIQPDKLRSIAINYPELDIKWLLTGVTEKTQSYVETTNANDKPYTMNTEPISEYLPTSNFKLLPLHSFDVVGGSHNQESDTMGYIMGYMPFVNAKDGDISVLVTGNSMYPTYPAGSYVQIRKIDYWREFLEFGQVHIIELMDDRRLIKEVRKGSDKKHLRLISHNENFDEVEISIDFVRSVWLVLAKYEKSVM
ncbi:S24 family peptidase [Dysgonomonas capnocytophagoides]|uniref:S24 family peptidase n=1 Tax=Dysgonomonas capnocytophagoides TaxID=45254 RepID=UPI00333F98F0